MVPIALPFAVKTKRKDASDVVVCDQLEMLNGEIFYFLHEYAVLWTGALELVVAAFSVFAVVFVRMVIAIKLTVAFVSAANASAVLAPELRLRARSGRAALFVRPVPAIVVVVALPAARDAPAERAHASQLATHARPRLLTCYWRSGSRFDRRCDARRSCSWTARPPLWSNLDPRRTSTNWGCIFRTGIGSGPRGRIVRSSLGFRPIRPRNRCRHRKPTRRVYTYRLHTDAEIKS